jgi:hypothetical protein
LIAFVQGLREKIDDKKKGSFRNETTETDLREGRQIDGRCIDLTFPLERMQFQKKDTLSPGLRI